MQRNAAATIWVATDDEWYKAAYYDPGAATYHDYPTGTDTPITCSTPTAASFAECADGVDNDGDGGVDFDPVTFLSLGEAARRARCSRLESGYTLERDWPLSPSLATRRGRPVRLVTLRALAGALAMGA